MVKSDQKSSKSIIKQKQKEENLASDNVKTNHHDTGEAVTIKIKSVSRLSLESVHTDGDGKNKKNRPFNFFTTASNKRLKYRRISGEELKTIQEVEKTIRGERKFLEKIEKCKKTRLQQICVCPLTRCYTLGDQLASFGLVLRRVGRGLFITCFPPLFCILNRAAFWPPPNAYFFFKPPPDDVKIDVTNSEDAVRMKDRKKRLTKVVNAKRCKATEYYSFGLKHPCANDVESVAGFVVRTERKNHIACIYIQCPSPEPPRFTMLYSHPNGSDLSDHLIGLPSLHDIARFYHCDVYSYDYTGYGISTGISSEKNMYADIRAIYNHIVNDKKVASKDIVLLGYSIGTAASVELVLQEKNNQPAGVVLQAPPASLLRVIGGMVKMKNLDKKSCCIDRFATVDKIGDVRIPVLVIHGEKDGTVPISHGKVICERAVTRVAPEWVPSGTHNNIENCREVWMRIRKFVKEELGFRRKTK